MNLGTISGAFLNWCSLVAKALESTVGALKARRTVRLVEADHDRFSVEVMRGGKVASVFRDQVRVVNGGLEVHDAGLYDVPLPPGAVFTVEPGVYLPERGFGVRIEDQVLMLGNGINVALCGGVESMSRVQLGLTQGLSDVIRRVGSVPGRGRMVTPLAAFRA